jgi:hypothetical protein
LIERKGTEKINHAKNKHKSLEIKLTSRKTLMTKIKERFIKDEMFNLSGKHCKTESISS